ncbi:MAG: hypothetical protein ACUVQ8_06985 [Nitrososphaeria archaeon]
MDKEYVFKPFCKLNFIGTKEGFLVFKNSDVLSGLTLKVSSVMIAITTSSGKEIAIVNLNLSQESSLVVLNARSLYVSPSNDSAVVSVECYAGD